MKEGMFLEKSIESILDIDRKTRELEDRTKAEIQAIDEKSRKDLSAMEYQRAKEAKEKARRSYEETLNSFEESIAAVKAASQTQLQTMGQEYGKVKDELVDLAFNKVLEKERADNGQ